MAKKSRNKAVKASQPTVIKNAIPADLKVAVTVGKIDNNKARRAKKGIGREAGMMIDHITTNNMSYAPGFVLDTYRNSYASGLGYKSGIYDTPIFIQLMNQKNGGLLMFPTSIQEKYSWYRFYARCFMTPEVPITMADGTQKKLKECKDGDKVINALGGVTEVSEVTTQFYEGDSIKFGVEGNLFSDLQVTPEHPFYVVKASKIHRSHNRVQRDGYQGRKTNIQIDFSPEWVEAKDIEIDDCLVVPKNKQKPDEDISVEQARLAGYFMAEGCFVKDNGRLVGVNWSLGSHEMELAEEIKELCLKVTGKAPTIKIYPSRPTELKVILHSTHLAKWLFENCGEYSHDKKLSPKLFNCSAENAKHIIATWLNGDGNRIADYVEGAMSGTTVSENMANQLYLMITRVGLTVSKIKGDTYEFSSPVLSGGTTWKLEIPARTANELIGYTKWTTKVERHFKYRKHNYQGNMLVPVRTKEIKPYSGLIWNISTKGKTYDEQTFLVYNLATHNTSGLVGRALDLLSDLPMSKINLHVPKHVPEDRREEIKEFFEWQVKHLGLFQTGGDILSELNIIGNCFIWAEYAKDGLSWERLQMLPPEEVFTFEYPFGDKKRLEYRPRRLMSLIMNESSATEVEAEIIRQIPEEIKESFHNSNCLLLNDDPLEGSFCCHIARRKAPYMDLSSSLLERVLIPLQLKDYYRFTQLSLASRNMTPKNIVTATGPNAPEIEELRAQVDASYLDPDYAIVANYEIQWNSIGARDRLLELSAEYERIDNEIFAGMGVTRELLTGEGSYSGSKITVEILHGMFLRAREIICDFYEEKLFRPICEKRKWFTEGRNGIKHYWYPLVGFNRLTIRDNAEVFESLFQLYQKGSLPVDIIYELFNLDPKEVSDKLYQDLFTVKDSQFNEFIRGVLNDSSRAIGESSDLKDKIAEYLKLKMQPPQGMDGGMGGGMGMPPPAGDMGGGMPPPMDAGAGMPPPPLPAGDMGGGMMPPPEQAPMPTENFDNQDLLKDKVDEVVSELPSGATDEQIMEKIVQKQKDWNALTQEEKDAIVDETIAELRSEDPLKAHSQEEIMTALAKKVSGI